MVIILVIDWLNSLVTEGVMLVAVNFSILAEIPSGSVDLDTSRLPRLRSNTSSSEQRRSAAGESRKQAELSFKLPMQYYITANDYNWVCSSCASCTSKVQDLVQGVHIRAQIDMKILNRGITGMG